VRKQGLRLAALLRSIALAALLVAVPSPTANAAATARAAFVPFEAFQDAEPSIETGQSAWRLTQIDGAWASQRGSPAIVVATIDTGVDRGHPDLAGAVVSGASFVSSPASVCPDGDGEDDNSHGTHIAGIIAAAGGESAGMTGVASGVRILPVKALDCAGFGAVSDVAAAIVWATDQGARIVNVSLGTTTDSPALDAAVRYAVDRDVLVVAAAGNCGTLTGRCRQPDQREYPAALPGVLAVGATDSSDEVAVFSTRGPQVALTAPGVRIVSTVPSYGTYQSFHGGSLSYGELTGTSQASAFVAGVAALVWSARPTLTAREVFDVLTATADDLGVPGRDDLYGYGRVNALRAVRYARAEIRAVSPY